MKSERYRRINRRLDWIVRGANLGGIVLTLVFFELLSESWEFAQAPAWYWFSITGGLVAIFVGTNLVGRRIQAPLNDWYRRATAGEEVEPPSLRVRQLALNQSLGSATLSLGAWLVASILFGSLGSLDFETYEFSPWTFAQVVLGGGLFSGLITATVTYFATERVWRPEIPLFFPEGNLSETPAFRLTVRRRLLILFVMVTIPLLLLAVVSYNYAGQIAQTSEPTTLLPLLLRLELYIAGLGILIAVMLALTLGASLAEPLETFSRQMDTVQDGDLEVRMAVTSNDELGALAEGFNAMVEGLTREGVVRRLFGNYVSPEVAEHAIEHGADLTGGDYCQATTLFTDIRGFTTLTEQMDPDAMIALLNRYFQTISTVVVEHGGLVTRLGGDSLLAVFGSPLNPAEDHPGQAVQAAWGLMPALAAFNQSQVRRQEPTLRIGVGVATGPVLAGNVGSKERLEYTVLGDAVNLASRLEAMTKEVEAQILLSEETARAVESWAPLQPIGEVQIRGKHEPVRVYALGEA